MLCGPRDATLANLDAVAGGIPSRMEAIRMPNNRLEFLIILSVFYGIRVAVRRDSHPEITGPGYKISHPCVCFCISFITGEAVRV